jgi:hypothetical protein
MVNSCLVRETGRICECQRRHTIQLNSDLNITGCLCQAQGFQASTLAKFNGDRTALMPNHLTVTAIPPKIFCESMFPNVHLVLYQCDFIDKVKKPNKEKHNLFLGGN